MRIAVLAAVAAGGSLGALSRFGIGQLTGGALATTVAVNLSGCLLIGLLAALVDPRGLIRPLLGTGALGGYTTFSGYALDVHTLVSAGRPLLAASYLTGTVVGALAAAWLGLQVAVRLEHLR